MTTKDAIVSQYLASLTMMKSAIEKCPNEMWDNPEDKNKFWHIAYHGLFYTHLYVGAAESDFKSWERTRENYQFMGPTPWPPHETPEISDIYSKTDLLAYVELCRNEAKRIVPDLDLEGPSGFEWIPLSKFELQFYNIRHLMQHTGELMERLGQAGIDVDWVGRGE